MEQLEKEFCLFVFARLLKSYNENFIVTDPVYDNTQPSRSIVKDLLMRFYFTDMLKLVPHTVNGIVSDIVGLNPARQSIYNVLVGQWWTQSQYKFVNEQDYITTMKSANFQMEPYKLSQKQLFNDFLNNYIGYGLVKKNKIDTRYLQQFEIRDGYSKLDTVVYLDDKMQFDYCKINGQKRTDELAIRECITAIINVVAIEKHLFQIHFLVADKLNILLDTLDKSNPVYRILIPITNDPYTINEFASNSLLGPRGVCSWFNFTQKGLKQYFEYVKENFLIRDFLIPKQLSGKSAIHKHQHLWFNCFRKFVSEFLSNVDCDDFIELLKNNYKGIYQPNKSKLENMIDICTMSLYSNIIHEMYSNSKLSKMTMNPYTLSTTWKQNDSAHVSDKINNLGEQTQSNIIAYATSLEAIRLDDERWIKMCCVNDKEIKIYQKFRKAISQLDIPEDAILHPKNISSSISY
jgi:hypothetical protein